jgi:predicted DCC family thiol-disulfide oxidoreductase YuxK
MFDERGPYIVYDGDCPFCSQYVQLIRLRNAIGPVAIVNARDAHPAVRYVKERGVDLNEEMALVMNGEIFSGADCMHRLALLSTGSGVFNAVTARVFANPGLARFLYPILRMGRNVTLKVLGRRLIPM